MVVSGDNSLNFGPEPLASLHHDVPVKGAQQHLHVLDQILLWGLALAYNSEMLHTK